MARFNPNRDHTPSGLKVEVRENEPFAKALSRFKRKVNDSGILKEVQDRQHYVKPSIERRDAKKAAVRRWRKYLERNKI
jgi:small subunit ribosomal protein S21